MAQAPSWYSGLINRQRPRPMRPPVQRLPPISNNSQVAPPNRFQPVTELFTPPRSISPKPVPTPLNYPPPTRSISPLPVPTKLGYTPTNLTNDVNLWQASPQGNGYQMNNYQPPNQYGGQYGGMMSPGVIVPKQQPQNTLESNSWDTPAEAEAADVAANGFGTLRVVQRPDGRWGLTNPHGPPQMNFVQAPPVDQGTLIKILRAVSGIDPNPYGWNMSDYTKTQRLMQGLDNTGYNPFYNR